MVPIIELSDQTNPTNLLWDKKAWPVYMTIANILSQTRNSPAKRSVLLVALLPVLSKLTGQSTCTNKIQRQINANSLHASFELVLTPLLYYISHKGMVMDCANGKTRFCFSILSAWIAHHADHRTLHGIGSRSCPKYEVP